MADPSWTGPIPDLSMGDTSEARTERRFSLAGWRASPAGQSHVGLQMEVPYTESLRLARKVKSGNGKVIWNLAPVPDQMTGAMIRDLHSLSRAVPEHQTGRHHRCRRYVCRRFCFHDW